MKALIAILLAVIAALLGFVVYNNYFKPDPCVTMMLIENDNPWARSPGGYFDASKLIPAKKQEEYYTAFYACRRSNRP